MDAIFDEILKCTSENLLQFQIKVIWIEKSVPYDWKDVLGVLLTINGSMTVGITYASMIKGNTMEYPFSLSLIKCYLLSSSLMMKFFLNHGVVSDMASEKQILTFL